MSIYQYKSGLQNAASYQASGSPFVTGSDSLTGVMHIPFPHVTKEIQLVVEGPGDGFVYFHEDATDLNKFHFGRAPTRMNVKCRELYVSSSNGVNFRVYAALTGIDAKQMFDLTGSGITE